MLAFLYLRLERLYIDCFLDLLCFYELIKYSEGFVQEIHSRFVCILCRRY